MAYQNSSRSSRPASRQRPGVRSFRPGKGGSRQGGGKRGAYIHPSKFINRSTGPAEQVVYEAKHKFVDFKFTAPLQANIDQKGYITPSAIQDQAIPYVLEGRDVIGLANTGTGKTAAFLLPIIEDLYANRDNNAVLIMAPTRELAQQIDEQFRMFSAGMKLYAAICVGGTNIERQIRDLRRGAHVIIEHRVV